jgi:Rieske Fe-S protein
VSIDALSRRSVLVGAVATAVGAVAGFVAARGSAAAAAKPATAAANAYGPAPQGGGQRLADLAAIPPGGGVVVDGVVVTRDAAGGVHGVSATCTHQGCTVGTPRGGTVTCPCHGSQFNAVTGAVLRGPATRPLPPIAVTVQGTTVVRS